jgi:cardiolipin synthase
MRRGWRLAALVCLFLFLGCASLPDIPGPSPVSTEQGKTLFENLPREDAEQPLARHAAVLEAAALRPLVAGNSVQLLTDGPATYRSMFEAIDKARDHINLETYIFEDDEVGHQFAGKLLAKQKRGVQINLMYDSLGSVAADKGFFDRMKQAGIRVVEYNPVNPLKRGKGTLNNRDHRKILVVDGKVAFTGGINVSEVYSSSSAGTGSQASKSGGWRDTHARIEGPVVAELQKLFLENWKEQKGPDLETRMLFPQLASKGPHRVRVVPGDAHDEISEIYYTFLSAINNASKSIHLTMAYFVPDEQTIRSINAAARRGVEVVMILPGYSDFWAVFHAGRSHYSGLLEAGVKIYEQEKALLHAKTAVIDGVWSTVGSSNLDWRSFLHNDEVNAVVLGADFAAEMEQLFQVDLERAKRIDPREWEQRSLWLRAKEQFARAWQYWF